MEAEDSPRGHPFVRLGAFIVSKAFGKKKKKYEVDAAEEDSRQTTKKKKKKKGGWLWGKKRKTDDDESEDEEDDDDVDIFDDQAPRPFDDEPLMEDLSGEGSEIHEDEPPSPAYDPLATRLPGEADMLDRGVGLDEEQIEYEQIERLPFKEIQSVRETVQKLHPKYQNSLNLIPDEKLTRAVIDKVERTRKATMYNGLLSFGVPDQPGPTIGHAPDRVPSTILVTGHKSKSGNAQINGVYERYPDDYHRRPVYQKYLEKKDLKRDRVIAASHAPKDGDTEIGPCRDAAFLYFDNLSGNWCISRRPGDRMVWARCPGVEEAIPDNLNRWEVWNVEDGSWQKRQGIITIKGGDPLR